VGEDQDAIFERIDARIAQYQRWQQEGRCYVCGQTATHLVSLAWMQPARLYCALHAADWGNVGYWRFVSLLDPEPPITPITETDA
jgi:hypothetical protein